MPGEPWNHLWQRLSLAQKHKVLGLFFIFVVALIWVLASFIVQEIEGEGLDPFVLTYIANSLFIVLLPVHYLRTTLQRRADRDFQRAGSQEEDGEGLIEAGAAQQPAQPQRGQPLAKQMLAAALVVAPIWFSAQWTFNLSLSRTTVSSNTILSATASLFTYGLALLILNDTFTWLKLASVLTCILGTALVTLADESNAEGRDKGSAVGDVLCLLSSFFYACYTVALRCMLKEDDGAKMMLFFGFVGLLNMLALFPILFVLVEAGLVAISGLTLRLFLLAVAKGLFDNVLSDYLWARAVLLVGPTVATVGLQMQIPIALVADLLYQKPAWLNSALSIFLMVSGTLAVLAGFLGVNLGTWSPSPAPREERGRKAGRPDDAVEVVDHGSGAPPSRLHHHVLSSPQA